MDRYALITGASSGIGMEIARELKKRGYNLILVARREDRLIKLKNKLNGNKDIILPYDLSKEENLYKLIEEVKKYNLNIFINCAGFGDCSEFLYGDIKKELLMIDVNVKAVHILTKEILKIFYEKNDGYILNVASIAGLFPAGPYMASYYATKAYVVSLTLAINREIIEKGKNVYVGLLCPGPVDTEFNKVASVKFALNGIKPSICAKITIKEMFKGKTIIIPTFKMKLVLFFTRFIPRKLVIKLTAHQQKKKIYR